MSEPKRLFFALELPLKPSGKSFTGARRTFRKMPDGRWPQITCT
jgi:hypothetical protein